MHPVETVETDVDTAGDDSYEILSTIRKIQELENLYIQTKNDAMKLRRKLEGKNIVTMTGNSIQSNRCGCVRENEISRNAVTQLTTQSTSQLEPPQKRGRGRPRKIKDSLELIRGDIDDHNYDDGTPRVNDNCICNSEKCLMKPNDEFDNAVYSIENEMLYVKTQTGKFYDVNTMQLRGWFNPYRKASVWVE